LPGSHTLPLVLGDWATNASPQPCPSDGRQSMGRVLGYSYSGDRNDLFSADRGQEGLGLGRMPSCLSAAAVLVGFFSPLPWVFFWSALGCPGTQCRSSHGRPRAARVVVQDCWGPSSCSLRLGKKGFFQGFRARIFPLRTARFKSDQGTR